MAPGVAETDRLAAPDCLGVEIGRHLRRHILTGALALRDAFSFDDALARRLNEPLATTDRRLARAAEAAGVPVRTTPA